MVVILWQQENNSQGGKATFHPGTTIIQFPITFPADNVVVANSNDNGVGTYRVGPGGYNTSLAYIMCTNSADVGGLWVAIGW